MSGEPTPGGPPILSGPEFKSDPYPAYAWLREHEPVFCHTNPILHGLRRLPIRWEPA